MSQPLRPHFLVRYGVAGFLGRFQIADLAGATEGCIIPRGARVLIRSERGLEIGEVLRAVDSDFVLPAVPVVPGELIRLATPADNDRQAAVAATCHGALVEAEALAAAWHLPLTILDVEGLFDPPAYILHVVRYAGVELQPFVSALAERLAVPIQVQDLTADEALSTEAGCGSCGSGCGSCGSGGCSTGGCGSGCADEAPHEFEAKWHEYFAELRERMDRRIALPAVV